MHHVCPMNPGGGGSQGSDPVDPSALHGDMEDEDDDERFILAAKRARSASLKEGIFEESPPSLLARLTSQNVTPSNLELSIIAARAAMERNRLYKDLQQGGSPPGLLATSPLHGSGNTPPSSAVGGSAPRSRKSRAPQKLNPSSNSPPIMAKDSGSMEPDLEPGDEVEAEPPTTPLPQSEPEDLSNKKIEAEDVNLDLTAITTAEVPVVAPKPSLTLSQMPIANK